MATSSAIRRCLGQVLRQPVLRALQQQQLLSPVTAVAVQQRRQLQYHRSKSTKAIQAVAGEQPPLSILSALPGQHLTAKVIFEDNTAADFKYIWLRDNCQCPSCMDPGTKQKLLDTPSLDVNIRPTSVAINEEGDLQIVWSEKDEHVSNFDPKWLFKYGQSFLQNTFEKDSGTDKEWMPMRSEPALWDRTDIWNNLPELSCNEFMDTEEGLFTWLDMFHKYGIAILRGVPTNQEEIVNIVNRFAYVKETHYGRLFDVINEPTVEHLAYSGVALAYHNDMNYREKSPGMQLLHCLKVNSTTGSGGDLGGRSMFVDGARAARWMQENEPTAFHVLTSTPVRFSIKNFGKRYSAAWPVICTDNGGDITELHYNNRTMQPLQAPTHVVTPFYHAYKMFSERLLESSAGLQFNLVPGDLVAFNNRRLLHGRSAYDAHKVDRHLKGCYVDIDETFSKYDQLLLNRQQH